MTENNQIRRGRGRPRGSGKITAPTYHQDSQDDMEPLKPEDFLALKHLETLPGIVRRLAKELKDPAIHKQFRGNVRLLMGAHEMPVYKLAETAGCSQSTLSRMLDFPEKFQKTSLIIFFSIAEALGVSVHTLLMVDLIVELQKVIQELERKKK